MANKSKLLRIHLLIREYTFYDNSIYNFELDFPSESSNEDIVFLDNNNKTIPIDSSNVLKQRYDQLKENYSKYNSDLAKKIYINKVRSINCYFIDKKDIEKLLEVDKISIKVISIEEPIIEKTITLIFNQKIIFNIIFEINENTNRIVVKKTHFLKNKNNISKSNYTKNIEINLDIFEKLKKINYDPYVITKNLELIKEIVGQIILENDIQNIVQKNLIYEINESNNSAIYAKIKRLIKINFNKNIKIKKPNSTNSTNDSTFGEIIKYQDNDYIFKFDPDSIKISQHVDFIKDYIKRYFQVHLQIYEYMKNNFFDIINQNQKLSIDNKKKFVTTYLGKYFDPELDVRFDNTNTLYLNNKKIGYFYKKTFHFYDNKITLNKIQNELNKLKIKNESSQYIKNLNNVVSMKDNIMIITYNEEAQKFDNNDVRLLIPYINNRNPSIIVVNTQESASLIGNRPRSNVSFGKEASHFQHILKNNLENNYQLVGKEDASVNWGYIVNPIKSNKNVRLRIYVKNNIEILNNPITNIYNDKTNKEINEIGKKNGLFFSNSFSKNRKIAILKSLDQYSPLQIINKKNKKKLNQFRKFLDGTIWKGSIYFPLYLQKNNKIKKFIFVNSHLYFSSDKYGKGKNTGLEKRKKMFIDLIKEFKLDEKYKEGYNIFFIGDLNFRLTVINDKKVINNENVINDEKVINKKNYLFNKNPVNTQNETLIKKYIEDTVKAYMEKNNNTLYKKDEIYNFLKKEINNSSGNMKNLLNKFKESIEKSKTFLSFKYKTDLKNNNKKLIENIVKEKRLENLNYNDIKKIFKTEDYTKITNLVKKVRNTNNDLATIIKPPSNPDRILYALHNINIKKDDLKMFVIPDKSDHKLITLNFDLNFN